MADRHAERRDSFQLIDAWFDVLSDPRRRYLCQYLVQTEAEIVTHEQLVEHLCERAVDRTDVTLDRQSIAMELRHVHLPKLDGLDAVEYDPRGKTVYVDPETISTSLEELQSMLEDIQDAQFDE